MSSRNKLPRRARVQRPDDGDDSKQHRRRHDTEANGALPVLPADADTHASADSATGKNKARRRGPRLRATASSSSAVGSAGAAASDDVKLNMDIDVDMDGDSNVELSDADLERLVVESGSTSLADFDDVFRDERISALLDEVAKMQVERDASDVKDDGDDTDTVVGKIPYFRMDELLQKLQRIPVTAARQSLFGDTVADDQLIAMTKQRSIQLPLFTAEYEASLLRQSGPSFCVTANKTVCYPPCVNGEQCIATQLPLQVRDLSGSESASSQAPQHDMKRDPTHALVLMQILYEDEHAALLATGSIHVEPRPCVLCMRYALYDFVLCYRSNRRDAEQGAQLDPGRIRLLQVYRSLVDEPGGYRSDQVVLPEPLCWEGFVDPFVAYRYSLLRVVYDTRSSCWFVDQRALLYEPPVVATPRVGETISHFRKRGIATLHAQVRNSYCGNGRNPIASRVQRLLEDHGLRSFLSLLAMSRDNSALPLPAGDTSANTRVLPDALRMRLWVIKRNYLQLRGSRKQDLDDMIIQPWMAGEASVLASIDMFISYVLQVDATRLLFFPSTVPDPWPFVQQAALFYASRARVDPVVHLINKCLPQRCQGRKSTSIYAQFFRKLLRDYEQCRAHPTEKLLDLVRHNWVVVQWLLVSLLGNYSRIRPRVLPSTRVRKLLLQTAAQRPQALLRFFADFPAVAVNALQEFVAHVLLDDDVVCQHFGEVLDVGAFATTCVKLGDAARTVVEKIAGLVLGVQTDVVAYAAAVASVKPQVEAHLKHSGKLASYAYYRERRTAWRLLFSNKGVINALRQTCEEVGVHPCDFDVVLAQSDSAIGATDSMLLEPVIDKRACAVMREALFRLGQQEYAAHHRIDPPLHFMKLAVMLCNCEGLEALSDFVTCAIQTDREKLGDRRCVGLLLLLVRNYPRTAMVLVWLSRMYAYYASGHSVLLPQHHLGAQVQASVRRARAEHCVVQGSDPSRPRLHLNTIILHRCRSCTMVCTLVQRLRQLYKWSYDSGYRNLHLDATSMRVFCKNYQNPDHPLCSVLEPVRAMLLGRLFRWKQTVYTLCGSPQCGAAMEWDPRHCAYRHGVYWCRTCTQRLLRRVVEAKIDHMCEFATKDCVYCGKSLFSRSALHVAFAPYDNLICAVHMENKAVSAFMKQHRWQTPNNKSLFTTSLDQTKRLLRSSRRERMKPVIARQIARSKQKTASRNKH